nr:MAG TPA: hypothetical protein [Caudoviricetes sp.]
MHSHVTCGITWYMDSRYGIRQYGGLSSSMERLND